MKKIYGEYFASGYAHSKEAKEIILDGINIIQHLDNWESIDSNIQAFGNYSNEKLLLDVYRIKLENRNIYFGCTETRMCWYIFFKFNKEDIDKLTLN